MAAEVWIRPPASVAGKERERERAVGGVERGLVVAQFLLRHRAQLGVVVVRGHVGEALGLLPQAAHLARGLRDRLELGIFLRHHDEAVAGEVAGRHQGGELVAARLDLADAVGGDGGHALTLPPSPRT